MSHFGRLWATPDGWTDEEAEKYLSYLRRMLGMPDKAIIDEDFAAELLERPRCGLPDPAPGEAIAALNKWAIRDIPYVLQSVPLESMPLTRWASVVSLAWKGWSDVSGIRGHRVDRHGSDRVGVTFNAGEGRASGFDGPGGVLAWAMLPTGSAFKGHLESKWDADEKWTDGTEPAAIRALNVTCHEIGHLLGLDHSRDPSDLMAPYYQPSIPLPQRGDIARIRTLYGAPGDPGPNPDPNPNPNPNPNPPPAEPPAPPADPGTPDGPGCPDPRWRGLPRLFPRRGRRMICP